MTRRLLARLDNLGDVLLAGPAVRAVSATADHTVFLAGPRGRAAADLLPGVDEVIEFDAPWVSFDPPATDTAAIDELVAALAERAIDEALILTSFHQSPLPLALLLRLAGVERLGATSVDYPGSLLDVRIPDVDTLHEVEQSLALCSAMGFSLPDGDDGRLMVELNDACADDESFDGQPFVVVHPGASVPARALPADATRDVVAGVVASGRRVVVTGSADEVDLAHSIVPRSAADQVAVVAGRTSFAETAVLIRSAEALVCGNTGVAHVAAAVQTPVVEVFAPVVEPAHWRPWRVPHVLLGVLDIACAGCRARTCPLIGQPCLAGYTADAVVAAVDELTDRAICEVRG